MGCCVYDVRNDSGNHAVQLEDGGDFDDEGRESGGRSCGRPWASTYSCDLYLVCPCNEECRVVLPMEGAFEQIRSGTVCRSVNEDDAHLRRSIVYFDTLNRRVS